MSEMSYTQDLELRQKMSKLAKDAQDISVEAAKSGKPMTSEDKAKQKRMLDEVFETKEAIERSEKLLEANAFLGKGVSIPTKNEKRGDMHPHTEMFEDWIRGKVRTQDALTREQRDFNITGGDTTGGVLVPTEVYPTVSIAQKPWSAMDDNAQVFETADGAPLKMDSYNDVNNEGEWVGESQPVTTDTSAPFSGIILGGYLADTKIIGISYQLLQDSQVDVQSILLTAMGVRSGRTFGKAQTVGNGSGQPTGIMTSLTTAASAAAYTVTAASTETTAISYPDVKNLFFKIYEPYRLNGKYMCNDNTLSLLAGMVDDSKRPIWLPAFGSANTPNDKWYSTLLGKPVVSNLFMVDAATTTVPLIFGDLSHYKIRKVGGGMRIVRLDEVLAQKGEVGFIGFERRDANYLDPGTHPIAMLKMN